MRPGNVHRSASGGPRRRWRRRRSCPTWPAAARRSRRPRRTCRRRRVTDVRPTAVTRATSSTSWPARHGDLELDSVGGDGDHRAARAARGGHPSGMVHQPERMTAEQRAVVVRVVRHDQLGEADLVDPVARGVAHEPMVAAVPTVRPASMPSERRLHHELGRVRRRHAAGVDLDIGDRGVERLALRERGCKPAGWIRLEPWTVLRTDGVLHQDGDWRPQPDGEPGVIHQAPIPRVQDRARCGGHDDRRLDANALAQGGRLGGSQRGLATVRNQLPGGPPGGALDKLVVVDKSPPGALGQGTADGRLAAAHHADQQDAGRRHARRSVHASRRAACGSGSSRFRPRTNHIAWTGMSPTLARRCGVVESRETASPGSRRVGPEADRDLERAAQHVAPFVAGMALERVLGRGGSADLVDHMEEFDARLGDGRQPIPEHA